jgi:uncharacterized membrane protein
MYLIVIAWLYVTLLMGLAEAFSTQGTVLGAIITFLLYGVVPMSLLVYVMGTPLRKKARLRAETTAPVIMEQTATSLAEPNASGHAPGLPVQTGITAMRKEP